MAFGWIVRTRGSEYEFMKCIFPCCGLLLALIASAMGQTPPNTASVTGKVVDVNGEAVPKAKVALRPKDGTSEQATASDSTGTFRFTRVLFGTYEIQVLKEAFKPTLIDVSVGSPAPNVLRIVLSVADLREEVTVGDEPGRVNTNSTENLDVYKFDASTLKNLPVIGNDVVGTVAHLLDASSVGTGGGTVLVDGLEVRSKIPANMIKEVRINQNPYSAEFARPGRGRIEIITKAGMTEYHGDLGLIFRDHHLDARNAFALERPPEQRRIFEGTLTGPLGSGKTTSFFFSGNREEEDLQAIVYAITPTETVSENVPTPQRQSEFSFRVDHQLNKNTTLALRLEINEDSSGNSGVGGYNLEEVGSNSRGGEHHLFFSLRQILSPTLINELTGRVGHEYSRTRSINSNVRKVIVQDAFTGGGAQADRRTTENHIQFNDIVSWTHKKHFVRAGLSVPDISRRGYSDGTNFDGTFTFSTLDDYTNGRPFLFSLNQGDGHVAFWQKDFATFVQDQFSIRPNFSLAVGLRYERQNYLIDNNNFAQRLSFAYAPGKQRKTVFRGGAGIFYDRTGAPPIADTLRFDGKKLLQVNLTNPPYPDPFPSGAVPANQPVNIVQFAPDVRSPYTIQFNIGVERQLTKSLIATANYINTRSIKAFRSRDINAPLPGSVSRPDPTIGVLRQIESSGRAETHMVEFMLRGNITRYLNATVQYNLGHAFNDTSGINARPVDNYDLSREWSRADFDERHRFNLLGTLNARDWFDIGVIIGLASGRPYSLTTGHDDNHDTIANDRPAGVRRNSLQGPELATVDLRWSKELFLRSAKNGKKADEGPSIKVSVTAFNSFNRVNFTGYVGNMSSPFFGMPASARPARRVQIDVSFSF
jgi:hypothetical protein